MTEDGQAIVQQSEKPLDVADARRIVGRYVNEYTEVRLHSGIGYVTPRDRLEGRDHAIWEERHQQLAKARRARRATRQADIARIDIPPLWGEAVTALP